MVADCEKSSVWFRPVQLRYCTDTSSEGGGVRIAADSGWKRNPIGTNQHKPVTRRR